MAQYIKHNSNYIKTVRHQFLKGGSTIFERDWVTVGSQLNFGPGKIPYYRDGNFIFTTSIIPQYQKKYKNGVTVATWTYDDVKDASPIVNQINLDEYTEDIRSYAYYGSCTELVRASIENIINTFPANITVSDEEIGIVKRFENCDVQEDKYIPLTGSQSGYYLLNNPFDINIFLKDVQITQYDNPLHYLSYSYNKYQVSTNNGGSWKDITSYEIEMRRLYEKISEVCYETVKRFVTSVKLVGNSISQTLSLEKGEYFIEVNGQKLNNWDTLCYKETDEVAFEITRNAKGIEVDNNGNVKLVLSNNTKQTIYTKSSSQDSVDISFYKKVQIEHQYKSYQMFTDKEYSSYNLESQGWVESDCEMNFWLPKTNSNVNESAETDFINRCDGDHGGGEPITYTIQFLNYDDTPISSVEVQEYDTVSAPSSYANEIWVDVNTHQRVSLPCVVDRPMTLKVLRYSVRFQDTNGREIYPTQYIKEGQKAQNPCVGQDCNCQWYITSPSNIINLSTYSITSDTTFTCYVAPEPTYLNVNWYESEEGVTTNSILNAPNRGNTLLRRTQTAILRAGNNDVQYFNERYSFLDRLHGGNQPLYTVTINDNIKIEGYIYDGKVIFLTKQKNLIIQPKDEVIEEYFDNLYGFEKQLLTRKTKPLYMNRFVTPIEYNLGYLYYKRTYTWPSNGYCIDITSPRYSDFITKLSNMAQLFDELWTDNLWRRMTHEAIKNYDWTYTREFVPGEEQDNVDGGERMHKVINVIGRVFDDIKRTIDTIKRNNKTTYNADRNIPNALLSDKLEVRGWDIYSTIPTYMEDVEMPSEITIDEVDNWYPTLDSRKTTFADVDVEFMRRLLLSTRRIFETKGTRHSIDMIMGMFGYGNMDEECYTITEEYYTVKPRKYDESVGGGETLGDRIVRLNALKEKELLYDEDASGIPVGSFIGEYDSHDNPVTYLIPFYNQDKIYDGNFCFQSRGGWMYKKLNDSEDIHDNPDPYKWTETFSYLHVVPQVKDLLSVNPNGVEEGDIFYVVNINDYIEFTENELFSRFFVLEDKSDPTRFDSWTNLNMTEDYYEDNGVYSDEQVKKYNDYVKKAQYLDSIIPYTIGNNPHVGYGHYDMGKEYLDYMKQPFKYSVDEHGFEKLDDENAANDIRFDKKDDSEIDENGKKYWEFYETSENNGKVQIFANGTETTTLNNYGGIKQLTYGEYKLDEIKNLLKSQYYINSKVIRFKNLVDNDQYKLYFRNIILQYLMQIIPSTAIFVLEGFALSGEQPKSSTKVKVHFLDSNGTTELYSRRVEPGQTVANPDTSQWYKMGDSSQTPVTFPYTINEETWFIKYIPPTMYSVKFYDEDTTTLLSTQSIKEGNNVSSYNNFTWYRKGDSSKTPVAFPHAVNSNENFVKLVYYTINFYEKASDTTPKYTVQATLGQKVQNPDSSQWYVKGDSSQTPVSFPYTVSGNASFVMVHSELVVNWYESE